jgi:serine protease Do
MIKAKSLSHALTALLIMVSVVSNANAKLPDFVELVEKSQPSVVSISTTIKVNRRNMFSRQPGISRGPSGSGFFISKDGYVLTNNHVIDGVEEVFVRLHNGKDLEAEIIGTDADTDIALLKLKGNNFKPFKIGNIEKTKVGSWVVAIGAPFGYDQTVTAGIISAKGRSVGEQYVPYIQTDVAINPGNSGGPLIDMNGRVVGINSKILSTSGGSNGLSFSIPIDLAMDVVNQIRDNGKVVRGYLGVNYQEVDRRMAKWSKLDSTQGALINGIAPGSPAMRAGIKNGDIVLRVDGKLVKNAAELPFIIGRYRPGDKAEFTIVREKEKIELDVTIGSRDGAVVAASPQEPQTKEELQWLGATLKELPEEVASRANVTHGVLVTDIDAGSAYDAGIRTGDIIQSIQLTSINNLAEFEKVRAELPDQGSVPILVNRPGAGSQYLILDL